MRAVVCTEFAPIDQLVIEDRPVPTPGPGKVVVAVRAAGVNYVDGLFVQGTYQIKPPLPFTPGGEVAGDVVAIGEGVEQVAVGDRVLAMPWLGGFASHVELSAGGVVPIPAPLSYGQAAALVQSYGTMLFALTRRTHVASGEWVLVLGAGGGIGLAAIDVARHLGARVIAAASTPE
jgi:NADPH2:quinone reductase